MNIFAGLNKHKRTGKRKDIYCVHAGGSFLKAFAEFELFFYKFFCCPFYRL